MNASYYLLFFIVIALCLFLCFCPPHLIHTHFILPSLSHYTTHYLPILSVTLHHASHRTGQHEVVHHLLEAGANPNVQHKKDMQSPLIRVCSQKKKPSFPKTQLSRDIEDIRHNLTKALLGSDADVNISDKDKNTALMAALENGTYYTRISIR